MTAFFRLLAAALAAGWLGLTGFGVYLLTLGGVPATSENQLILLSWLPAAGCLAGRAAGTPAPAVRRIAWGVGAVTAVGWVGRIAYLNFVVGPFPHNVRFVVFSGFILAASGLSAAGLLLDTRPAGATDDDSDD